MGEKSGVVGDKARIARDEVDEAASRVDYGRLRCKEDLRWRWLHDGSLHTTEMRGDMQLGEQSGPADVIVRMPKNPSLRRTVPTPLSSKW